MSFGPESHTPEFLAINPNGRVPALDDDGLILWESIAINLHLAAKYGSAPFWPDSPENRGRCYQCSLWGVNEIEPRAYTLMANLVWNPPERRDLVVAQRSTEELKEPFGTLEAHLNTRGNLLGNEFTIADLNVASISGPRVDASD